MNRVAGGFVALLIGLLAVVVLTFVEARHFGVIHMRAIIGIGIAAGLAFLGIGERAGLFRAAYSSSQAFSLSGGEDRGDDAEVERMLRKPVDADAGEEKES